MQKSCVKNIKSKECGIELLKERRQRLNTNLKIIKRKIKLIDSLLETEKYDQKRS